MKTEDEFVVWIGALRYYMGRTTYATNHFCQVLLNEWDTLSDTTKLLIERDLEEQIQFDDKAKATNDTHKPLGSDSDKQVWMEVAKKWRNNT